MRTKRSSPLWDFLENSGVLESGSDEEIKAIKRKYRKKYLLNYKRTKRRNTKEFTLAFKKGSVELNILIRGAKSHHLTVSSFISQSSLAYLQQNYLIPNALQVAELEQMLSNCLNEIRAIANRRDRFFWDAELKLDRIEKRILKMEDSIDQLFRNPKKLNQ